MFKISGNGEDGFQLRKYMLVLIEFWSNFMTYVEFWKIERGVCNNQVFKFQDFWTHLSVTQQQGVDVQSKWINVIYSIMIRKHMILYKLTKPTHLILRNWLLYKFCLIRFCRNSLCIKNVKSEAQIWKAWYV